MGDVERALPQVRKQRRDRGSDALPSLDERAGKARGTLQQGDVGVATNSFLGREDDLREVTQLLDSSRLVTVTGPPGIGKSRLVAQLARDLGPRCSDGGWLVELAGVREAELVPAAVAAVLSLAEEPGQALEATIVERLRGRDLLLALDDCDHLIEACARLGTLLLRACPGVRILAASREPLSVTGEHIWQLGPLSAPPVGAGADLPTTEAVALFADRAAAADPAFALKPENLPAVAEICRRLDGIPLAIELAATCVPLLTLDEIAGRLDDRFVLLTGGGCRSEQPRHQTLEAAIEWSHDLLSEPEQRMLARLSVFVGGFSLEAAEAVTGGGDVPPDEVLDLLTLLVSKSLVMANTINGQGRYRMLETIRAFAADRLVESSDGPGRREAHAQFYLGFAERAEPEFTGPDQARWFALVATEHENLRAAIGWTLHNDHVEWGLRISGALVLFWRVRCHFTEGRRLLEAAVASHEGPPSAVTAKAQWGVSFMALMTGDGDAALAAATDALPVFGELGDPQGWARALLVIGNGKLHRDEPDWRLVLEHSAALAGQAGDTWCQALALFSAGFAYAAWDDLHSARPLLEECLEVARGSGQRYILNYGLIGLGKVALREGCYPEAHLLLADAVDGARELGDEYTEAAALEYLAELELRRGELGPARALLEDVLATLPDVVPRWSLSGPLLLLGAVAHAEGDATAARGLYERAIDGLDRDAPRGRALLGLGQLALEEGDHDGARRLFEEALELGRSGPHDNANAAVALHGLAEIARDTGNLKRASALHNEALALRRGNGAAPEIVASIEAIAGLAAATGGYDRAARLLAACRALREQRRYAETPWLTARHKADLARVSRNLTRERFRTAVSQGKTLSLDDAIKLASRGRGRRGQPPSGWSSLTEREQEVAMLVADGLTNPEIAEHLELSLATVKAHVARAFPKLAVTSRRELAREVRRRQQPSFNETPAG